MTDFWEEGVPLRIVSLGGLSSSSNTLAYQVEYAVRQENGQHQDGRELGELHQNENNHTCEHLYVCHSEELEAVADLGDPHRDQVAQRGVQ